MCVACSNANASLSSTGSLQARPSSTENARASSSRCQSSWARVGRGPGGAANGAWRDRPLPVEGAEQYVGKGLIYQNPFIIWFNHCDEKDYAGERFVRVPGNDRFRWHGCSQRTN